MTARTLSLYADNPKFIEVILEDRDTATLEPVPLTTGLTAFLALTNTSTATAAGTPALTATCTHMGNGHWSVVFTAVQLAYAAINGIFGATPTSCYLLLVKPSGLREYVPMHYYPEKPALIAA